MNKCNDYISINKFKCCTYSLYGFTVPREEHVILQVFTGRSVLYVQNHEDRIKKIIVTFVYTFRIPCVVTECIHNIC